MNKLFFLLSVWSAKYVSFVISILHIGQASNVPGRIALYLNQNLFKYFNIQTNCKIILITGTNGKSTTCGLLANILKTSDKRVIYNKSGANLLSGIASTFCHYSTLLGKLNCDYIILEVDEATLHLITKKIHPDIIGITNLFRDQLDRFGELDTTAQLIERGIQNNKDSIIFLNADDSRVAFLKTENKKIYYGIDMSHEPRVTSHESWLSDPEEMTTCPECKSDLLFSHKSLAHLGNYSCTKCNLKKPKTDFSVTDFKTDSLTINFDITHNNSKNNLFLPMIGTFNLYNALCAIAIAKTIANVTNLQIQKAFNSYSTIFGRGEKLTINKKNAWVYLIKNPTGTTEVLKTLCKIPNARFLIAINDNYADGRDVSWLWDARFDFLQNHQKNIFISGRRAFDIALRLKYANISTERIKVNENIIGAINKSLKSMDTNETLYILPTYTVLLEMQRKGICKDMPLN
jgi:UDP-N-acetylmuramyl tripeptide synthase